MNENIVDRKVSTDKYTEFIKQLDIKNIRLVDLKLTKVDLDYTPELSGVNWKASARYENIKDKINIFHTYGVKISEKASDQLKAQLSMTFCVTYSSNIQMNDEIFKLFIKRNLPINTWPYFRELTQSITLRIGWPAFIAPKYEQSPVSKGG